MIILVAYVTTDGKYLMMPPKVMCKWENDTQFPFNIGSSANWYFYLKQLRVDGKLLPLKTEHGTSIAYRVYIWGGFPGVPGLKGAGAPTLTLFPGIDNKATKLKIATYGRIDQNEQYWLQQLELQKKETHE